MALLEKITSRSAGRRASATPDWMVRLSRFFFSDDVRVKFYKKIAVLIAHGVKIQDAVDELQRRAARRSSSDTTAIALQEISQRMRSGRKFARALEGYAPFGEILVIQAGERGGGKDALPNALYQAAELIVTGRTMRQKTLEAVSTPVILLAMVVLILLVISLYVVPQLALAFDPKLWTGIAGSLVVVSDMVRSEFSIAIIVATILSLVIIFVSLKKWSGGLRPFADKIPPWSFYRLLVGSGWLMSLAALIASGVTVQDALIEMRKVANDRRTRNPYLRNILDRTLLQLRSGKNLGDALDATKTDFPDRDVIDDLMVYSAMPNFDENLRRLGRDWAIQGKEQVAFHSRILSMVAWTVIGAVMTWIILGIIELQNQIGSAYTQGM